MAAQQCSRCDTAAECVDQGLGRLEDIADVLGVPTPSLHVHLVQHDRDDVLSALTYGGKPIIDPTPHKVEETTVVVQADPEPAPDIVDQEEPEPLESNDRQMDWQAGLVPGHPEDHDGGADEAPALAELVTGPPPDEEIVSVLEWLAAHEVAAIRALAVDLLAALEDHAQQAMDRQRLEELVAQRDDLNQQIDALAAKLGDLDPQPVSQPRPVDPAAVRVWARSKGLNVAPTGKIARRIIDGYLAEVRP